MLEKSLIGRVLLQLLGVGAYFALVVILYWRGLTDAGAVAIILGLLFLFKTVVDSGAISLGHLAPFALSVVSLDSRWR
jgi:Na+/proline symporter